MLIYPLFQDKTVNSSDESVVPMNELTERLLSLRSTDSSPSRPTGASSPISPGFSQSGQLLVSKECSGHCECLDCMKCIYCAICEECKICQKCRACKYPARQLKRTDRSKLSNDSIKRRIGIKAKSGPVVPAFIKGYYW